MNFYPTFIITVELLINLSIICGQDVSVTIKNGKINGKLESFEGRKVNVFLGIPYAEPPVGNLRFRRPLPKKGWTEPIDATHAPDSCYQTNTFQYMIPTNDIQSEDCLYLNIWSPDLGSINELKPVIVIIHGGAYMIGSSLLGLYSGDILSTKGDVVVVSLNYRLNIFGFLYTGTDDAPGNVGLWDQSLALEWVNDNIKYFGGDPNQITIFGVSAGSWSVGLHIISLISRNLFSNAIMMSGAAIDRNLVIDAEEGVRQWVKISKLSGCTDIESTEVDKFSKKLIKCLKDSDPELLVHGLISPELTNGTIGWLPMVVIDGQFLTDKPLSMLRAGNHKTDLNLMFSLSHDEGSPFLQIMSHHIKYRGMNPQNFSYFQAFNELKTISESFPTLPKINGEDVSKLYFTGLSDNNDFDLLRRTIGIAIGDFVFSCPSIQFAKELFNSYKNTINVYQYYYNYKSQFEVGCMKWMGVCHGSDSFMFFGLPFRLTDVYSDRDRQTSQLVIDILSNFAKSGHPPKQNGVDWPKFYTINDNIICPYLEINGQPKPDTNFSNNLKISECDHLWKTYIDKNL